MVTPTPETLADLLKQGGKVTIEREETPEDADLRRRKDWVRFLVGIAGILAITLVALAGAFGPWSTDGQQEIAQTILTLVVGAFGGYIVGRNTGD